jgi:Glycosyltransferase 61
MAASVRNVSRLFGGPTSVAETAFEQEVLCPSEESELSPSIFLKGQLEKITGAQTGASLASQMDQTLRRTVKHAPTIAYHIRNAILFDGCVYAGRMKSVVAEKGAVVNKRVAQFGTAAICSSVIGAKYFGHWLCDDVLTYVLAGRYGNPICCSVSFPSDHKPIYERIFEQDWRPTDRARIDHLILFQDFAQTSLKRRRQLDLRNRVLRLFPPTGRRHLIYLKRGDTGESRLIENESEIIDDLTRRGFVILDIKTDSLERILSHLVSAEIVISIEGSQTTHGSYSIPKGSGMLFLQLSNRFTASQRGWTENLGAKFGFVVGEPRENATYFSASDILKTVDLFFQEGIT